MRGPIAVEIETICILVADEVREGNIMDRTTAAVGFEQEHVIRVHSVNIVVGYVVNVCEEHVS